MRRLVLIALLATSAHAQGGLPLGLGIVTPVDLGADRPLYFFGADGAVPLDSVTFREGPHHFEIATAPPWLDPETVKLDYDTITFRAVALAPQRVEVVVHNRDVRWPPRTLWLDREAVVFQSWPEYLLGVHSVETAEPAPLFSGPSADAARVGDTAAGRPLRVLVVEGAWMQVADAEATEATAGPRGWLRWHDGARLLVHPNLLS